MLDALPANTREVVTLVLSRGTVDHAGGGAIFDRDHIIHEPELLDAGDQLVASLAPQAQAAPAIGHAQGGQVTGQQRPIPPG